MESYSVLLCVCLTLPNSTRPRLLNEAYGGAFFAQLGPEYRWHKYYSHYLCELCVYCGPWPRPGFGIHRRAFTVGRSLREDGVAIGQRGGGRHGGRRGGGRWRASCCAPPCTLQLPPPQLSPLEGERACAWRRAHGGGGLLTSREPPRDPRSSCTTHTCPCSGSLCPP